MNEQEVLVPPRRLVNTTSIEKYNGAELRPYEGRPGAVDSLALPSRYGQELRFRDGRVESLT